MSVARNHARLDIQLYVELPDEVLEKFSVPGYKPKAMDVLRTLLVGIEGGSPHRIVEVLEPYILEWRTKVSGGNVQLARNAHMTKGDQ